MRCVGVLLRGELSSLYIFGHDALHTQKEFTAKVKAHFLGLHSEDSRRDGVQRLNVDGRS